MKTDIHHGEFVWPEAAGGAGAVAPPVPASVVVGEPPGAVAPMRLPGPAGCMVTQTAPLSMTDASPGASSSEPLRSKSPATDSEPS